MKPRLVRGFFCVNSPCQASKKQKRLIERTEMRLEQYRISRALTADAATQDTVQRLEGAVAHFVASSVPGGRLARSTQSA